MTFRSLPPSAAPASPTPAAVAQARFWDRIARKYAADPIADLAGYETTLQRVRELLAPQHSVLEVGCGTGSTALRLAACTGRWVATDVSREMIAIAGEKLAAAPLPLPQLHFEVADAEAGVPGGGPYDVLLAFNLLHLVSDLDAALSSLLAAVKPGGLFISKTACLAEMNPLIPYLLLPLMRAIGKAPHALIFDAGQLRSAFERHGWVVEAVERHGTARKDFRVFIVARKPL